VITGIAFCGIYLILFTKTTLGKKFVIDLSAEPFFLKLLVLITSPTIEEKEGRAKGKPCGLRVRLERIEHFTEDEF
jgi:hypothetical protein